MRVAEGPKTIDDIISLLSSADKIDVITARTHYERETAILVRYRANNTENDGGRRVANVIFSDILRK